MHTYDRIWRHVARIPRGTVATYGDVARSCGLSGHARLVGYALHNLPPGADIPWFRVVNARGKVSLGGESGARQQQLLENEGIVFSLRRIDLATYRWRSRSVQNTVHRHRIREPHSLSEREAAQQQHAGKERRKAHPKIRNRRLRDARRMAHSRSAGKRRGT